jgi:anaerobic selenocysteine-containing dehydrogenase
MLQPTQPTICPRDCYDSCALQFEAVAGGFRARGGRVDAINKGDICGKCGHVYNDFAARDRLRILEPLLNVGRKGDPHFKPISWEEALGRIVDRVRPLLADGRAEAVLYTRYDGARGLLAREFPVRFFNAIGATGVVPGSVCHTAGLAALEYVFGTGADGVDPREFANAETILLWGINPHHSSPHAWRHWIAGNAGATVVRIDPLDRGESPPPQIKLRPRPGTDAILAFGMMRTLLDEDLIDRDFIAAETLGFERLEPMICQQSVEDCAEGCGVPADAIRAVARRMARSRTIVWVGMGLQRQAMGGNIFRAIAMLPALTGNIGRSGAGFVYLNGARTRGLDLSLVAEPATRTMLHGQLNGALADPARAQALFCWNNNIAVSNPDLAALHGALSRADLFTVCLEIRRTRTCAYADLVLPAADFVEYDDLVYSYFFNTIGAQVKLRDPLGRSLPNQEIFRRIARSLGMAEPALFESDESVIARVLDDLPKPIGFAELSALGTWHAADQPRPARAAGLPTPSGRIELASERASAAGLPATALPLAAPPSGGGGFRLLTPASYWRVNSGFLEHERIAEFDGEPGFLLHPDDARRLGVAEGDVCRLSTETGSVLLPARISTVPQPGVLVVYKCRGEGADPAGIEINRLMPAMLSDMGGCIAFQGIAVALEPMRQRRAAAAPI